VGVNVFWSFAFIGDLFVTAGEQPLRWTQEIPRKPRGATVIVDRTQRQGQNLRERAWSPHPVSKADANLLCSSTSSATSAVTSSPRATIGRP